MKRIPTILSMAMGVAQATGLEAQRGEARTIALSPPSVRASATPLAVTLAWRPVDGAASYTVEQALSLNGPWTPMPVRPLATEVTVPTLAGYGNGYGGGTLNYYRVAAVPSLGEPGITVVPRVIPKIDAALGVEIREDGADLWVSWEPVPYASGYRVTVAPGPQLAPTHMVEVGAQTTETRLVNVALPNTPLTIWVAVNARYGAVLSSAVPQQFTIPGVQQCWPPNSVPLSAPYVAVRSGPTSVVLVTGVKAGQGTTRVERAPMGSQAWQNIGCKSDNVLDARLMPGTQYQYRVTAVWLTGQFGQAIVVAATSAAPDNQTPTATVSGCTSTGCLVTLNWMDYPGNAGVRIESSYGLSQVYSTNWLGKSWNGPTTGTGPNAVPIQPSFGVPLPKGIYSFSLATLYRPMRPAAKAPGQVTVVVP